MTTTHFETTKDDLHYLQLLSQSFPTIADASTEIINLEAVMALPKGTEHFLADLHGESGAFQHVLKNASGNIKRKVNELFGNNIRESEKKELCTLIYYPEQKLELIKTRENYIDDWYSITIHQLVRYVVMSRQNTPDLKCASRCLRISRISLRNCSMRVCPTLIRLRMSVSL